LEPVVLLLVLCSAFFHALWNALLKRHEDPEAAVVGVIAVSVVSGAVWALGMRGAAFATGPVWRGRWWRGCWRAGT
jgi:hypothetical protein